jgi:hypothetical protein
MSMIGSYDVPDLDLDEAINAAKQLEQNTLGKEVTKEAFAKALGQSANSGALFVKLADLKRYGLISGRADKYKTTDLAHRLAYPTDNEQYSVALNELILGIDLFKKLKEHFGNEIQPNEMQFGIGLQQITGEHPEKLKNKTEKIRKIYIDKLSNITMPTAISQTITSDSQIKTNEGGLIKLYYGDKVKLEMEETVENIDLLISALQNRKKKLGEQTN